VFVCALCEIKIKTGGRVSGKFEFDFENGVCLDISLSKSNLKFK